MSADSHLRSLAKAFSWRIVATLTTATIAWVVTGSLDTAALIGGIEFVLKFFIYYLHERAWTLVPSGAEAGAEGEQPQLSTNP